MNIRSDFESHWLECPPASAIIQERRLTFDSYSALTYGPVTSRFAPIVLSVTQPDDEWIASALDDFVLGEFGTTDGATPPFPDLPRRTVERSFGDEHHRYLAACERDLIYSNYFEALIESSGNTIAERIHALLSDRRLGNETNQRYLDKEHFQEILQPLIAEHMRIRFVMPAFPFKDQNPFRTAGKAFQPDLGDIGLLIRLHCLALALWHVYPDGFDWILLSDGTAYSSIFGVEAEEAREYLRRLKSWRDELNMQRTVALVDLADLVQRADTAINGSYRPLTATRAHIRDGIERGAQDNDLVRENLAILKRGMARNLNTRNYLGTVPLQDLWSITRGGAADSLSDEGKRVHSSVDERALEAALEYASFNLAMRYHDVIGRYLPQTVRATTHPKPGQVAAPSLGRVTPWNGVALERGGAFDHRTLTVLPLYDLTSRYPQVLERQTGDGGPLYYTPLI